MIEEQNLEKLREKIDVLDKEIVKLLAERSQYVKQASKSKKTEVDVKSSVRVEQVIGKVRTLAMINNMNPDLAEEIYRSIISSFINYEMKEYIKIQKKEAEEKESKEKEIKLSD